MLQRGMPVTSGSVLMTIHAELSEMVRELNQSRLVTTAIDRICNTRPELRAEIAAEMQRIAEEQEAKSRAVATAVTARPKKR